MNGLIPALPQDDLFGRWFAAVFAWLAAFLAILLAMLIVSGSE